MEEKFKELAYSLKVEPSEELWKRFQQQRKPTKKRPIGLAIAASLLMAISIHFFYPKNTYQLQPLEYESEYQPLQIVSINDYPTIEEGNGKIKVAPHFN
jgi:hypothetical protein